MARTGTTPTPKWLARAALLTIALTLPAIIPGSLKAQQKPSAEMLIKRMDKNGDGAISISEYTGKRVPFTALDTDGDGKATESEIEKALEGASTPAGKSSEGGSRITFGPLAGEVFGAGRRMLLIMVHGDVSRGGPADSMYRFAPRLAAANRGLTTAVVLRPGYEDSRGNRSPGNNFGRSDQYTAENNDLLAETIADLKRKVGARKTVVVAHSGGAAQTGVVIGRYPGLVDVAVLVSCPCNLDEWRRGETPLMRSQSPHDYITSVPRGTRVILITGTGDDITPPRLAEAYARDLGDRARFRSVEGADHPFPGLFDAVALELGLRTSR